MGAQVRSRPQHTSRAAAALMAVVVLAATTVACTTSAAGGGPGGPGGSTAQFCDFWDRVEDWEAADGEAPTSHVPVLVTDQVVALAEETDVVGEQCTDPGAMIDLDDAVLAEGELVDPATDPPIVAPAVASATPSAMAAGDESTTSTTVLPPQSDEPYPMITGPELGADAGTQAVTFDNLELTSLSAEIGTFGIRLRGSLAVTLSGATSSMNFVGTLSDLQNWSVSLSSGAFTVPGITTQPVQFSGVLRSSWGVQSLSLTASAPEVVVDDVRVTGATISLEASDAHGISADVVGTIEVGPSTASGAVSVAFDRWGNLVAVDAAVDAHLTGFQAGGGEVEILGAVTLKANDDETVASISGSGHIGDVVVHQASGHLTMAHEHAVFEGYLDIDADGVSARVRGRIEWNGDVASVTYLDAQVEGHYSGVLEDGTYVAVEGELRTQVGIGGVVTTYVAGEFEVGSLSASGEAVVRVLGDSTELEVDAEVTSGLGGVDVDGSLSGVVRLRHGAAELVDLEVGVNSLSYGGMELSDGMLTIESSGTEEFDVSVEGRITVGDQVELWAELDAELGPSGLLYLAGGAFGEIGVDGWNIRDAEVSVEATQANVTLHVSGRVEGGGIAIAVAGTFTADLVAQDWSFRSTERTTLYTSAINIGVNGVRLEPVRPGSEDPEALLALRATAKVTVLLVDYVGFANVYLEPDGGCRLYVWGREQIVTWALHDQLGKNTPCSVDGPLF